MELWDLYDANRRPLGRKHLRGLPMKKGCYHLAVFVWVFDRYGRLLLTKRSPEKPAFPNLWALTGGAVIAGESSVHAVRRELFEETGIRAKPSEFSMIDTYCRKNCFCDVYFLKKTVPLERLVMQEGETCDAKWVSRAEFEMMARRKQIAQPDVKRYAQLGSRLDEFFK